MQAPEFNKLIERVYPDGPQFTFHKIEQGDTIILNILIDGVADTTMEIPLNSQHAINILSNISNFDEEEPALQIEPRIIIGDHNNFKIQIISSQIGKLILQKLIEPKVVILSIGARWFGKGDETTEEDFDKLMFVLENVKQLMTSN